MKNLFLLPFVLCLLVFATLSQASEKVPIKITGPFVGNVTHNSATIWLHATQPVKLNIHYYPKDSFEHKFTTFTIDNDAKKFKVTLPNLKPNTQYNYNISYPNNPDKIAKGSFTTSAKPNTPTKFRLAVTSCMKFENKNQTGWLALLKQKPDTHLIIGDSHYADTTDYNTIWKHHLRYRKTPNFSKVIANMSTYGVWDDHDFGPNNSDGTAKGKENSLRAYKQIFANPSAGTKDTKGIFHTFKRGDVQFFMLDTRYHRSPNSAPDNDKKRMLGDRQFNWLKDQLKKSTAKFKVLVCGSTLDSNKNDSWVLFSFATKRLHDMIADNKIQGVFFITGDVHASFIKNHKLKNKNAYPITEVISSGITQSKERSFAILDFDTTRKDPQVKINIMRGDNTLKQTQTLKFSQLQIN